MEKNIPELSGLQYTHGTVLVVVGIVVFWLSFARLFHIMTLPPLPPDTILESSGLQSRESTGAVCPLKVYLIAAFLSSSRGWLEGIIFVEFSSTIYILLLLQPSARFLPVESKETEYISPLYIQILPNSPPVIRL